MSLPLHISPRIIKSIASLYNDTNRIFMEYIDNSLDSAEEFYNAETNTYNQLIHISLKMFSDGRKIFKVIITDSCTGIRNFSKVVQSIGNSDKKEQPWTNGQFGYGIYSFMAACERLKITTREIGNDAHMIEITRKKFETDNQENVFFNDPVRVSGFQYASGSIIELSEFDKNMLKQIDCLELKKEIERHFEMLLHRKNLEIVLVDENNVSYTCEPFDYTSIDGDVFDQDIKDFTYLSGRKMPKLIEFSTNKPVHVYLKITKGKVINKPPVFISKGRRIAEIKDVKSFTSKHKSDIWGHPNITGYVDLLDYIDPTIARNDFKNNDKSKALYNALEEIEPLILEFIKEINSESESKHYKNLEEQLNKALSKLAKIDSMNFRTEVLSGNTIPVEPNGSGQNAELGFGKKDHGEGTNNTNKGGNFGGNEGEGTGPSGKEGTDLPGGEGSGNFPKDTASDNPFSDSNPMGDERKRSGFNISIKDTEPPVDDRTSKPLRSLLIDGSILIYRKHPDFEKRVSTSKQGSKKLSQRLITYLAGEITVHYKDTLQMRRGQAEYNKAMFQDLVDFIYQFEDNLSFLVGTNLSDLSSTESTDEP